MPALPGCSPLSSQRHCPGFPVQQQQRTICNNIHPAPSVSSACVSATTSPLDRTSHHRHTLSRCSFQQNPPRSHLGLLAASSSLGACGIPAGICTPARSRAPHPHTTTTTAASSSAAADHNDQQPTPSSSSNSAHASQWDLTTERLVASASLPFSVLVLPQVFQNLLAMYSGNAAALSIISWEGYVSGLLGNTLMCTHFAGRGERSAVNVQLIGMVSSVAILTQVALSGYMPAPVFAAAVALAAVAAVLNTRRLQGRLQDPPAAPAPAEGQSSSGWSAWRVWQMVCGTLGLAVVPQILGNIFAPGQLGPLLGAGTLLLLLALCLFFQTGGAARRQAQFQVVGQLPGWGATLLFALSPLPQLVRNFLEPQSLQGLSVATMLLALLGNSMMLPRSLFTADPVWMAGTIWACLAGWGQLLSMFLGTSAATGQRYLAATPFAAVTAVLVAFVSFTLTMDAKSKLV